MKIVLTAFNQKMKHEHKGRFFMAIMKCKCGSVGFPLTKEAAKRLTIIATNKDTQ